MNRYYELDDGGHPPEAPAPARGRGRALSPEAIPARRGGAVEKRRSPTQRAGKQIRTVLATGKSTCGGNSRLVGFGVEDLAAFVGMTGDKPGRAAAAFRAAVQRGIVDPLSLESLVNLRDRRGALAARAGVRVQVSAGGRRVAAATLLCFTLKKSGISATVTRVAAVKGGKWEGREVEIAVPLGGQRLTFRGTLTRTRFDGG